MSIAQRTTNRKEAVTRANRIRGATNLNDHPDFDRVPGKHFVCIAEGLEFRLRFDYMWTITCQELNIEFQCLNQPPQGIAELIREKLAEAMPDPAAWLTEGLPQTTGPNL